MNHDSQCQTGCVGTENSTGEGVPFHVAETKQFRKDLDGVLQNLKKRSTHPATPSGDKLMARSEEHIPMPIRSSRERSLAITKLEECIMWLGMDLKAQDTPTPYPHSYDPKSPIIDKTADGLKL